MKSKAGQGGPKDLQGLSRKMSELKSCGEKEKDLPNGLDASQGSVDFDRKIFMWVETNGCLSCTSRLPMAVLGQLFATPQDETKDFITFTTRLQLCN